MKRFLPGLVAAGVVISGWLAGASAQNQPLAKAKSASTADGTQAALRKTMDENFKATQSEDVDAMMKTVHSESPLFAATRQQVSQIFGKGLNLKYELLSFKYLTTDGDYTFGRARQRTTKTPPEGFTNNEVDMVVSFRQEGGAWKIWSQMVLEVKRLNP